jgi:ubiquinone/menaquinone biosynthesis C-methylase UbiE
VKQSLNIQMEDEIESRIRLYDFSTGKQTFFQWQAGMLPPVNGADVLELGCGNGALWRDLILRWSGCRMTMTDIADDVLDLTRHALAPMSDLAESVKYLPVDFNNLPFSDESFDVIIANHNLYYALDVPSVLSAIHRILRPEGRLICSTIGRDHLCELAVLLRADDPEIPWGAENWAEKFGLDNGADLLAVDFQRIDQFEYDNSLHVNSLEPVLSYLMKTMKGSLSGWVADNQVLIEDRLNEAMSKRGYIRLTPHSGFFIARKSS